MTSSTLIDDLRIPIAYLASFLSAGDESQVRRVLTTLAGMRRHMRARTIAIAQRAEFVPDDAERELEALFRLLALALYDERFVIPKAHREEAAVLEAMQGSCGLEGIGGPGRCIPEPTAPRLPVRMLPIVTRENGANS